MCLVTLIGAGGLAWVSLFILRKYRQNMAKYRQEKARVEGEDIPRWQAAMRRWEAMYYCARDETVFIAGQQQGTPIAEAQALINRDLRP